MLKVELIEWRAREREIKERNARASAYSKSVAIRRKRNVSNLVNVILNSLIIIPLLYVISLIVSVF